MKIYSCTATYADDEGREVTCMGWMDYRPVVLQSSIDELPSKVPTVKCRICGFTIELNPKEKGKI